MNIKITQIFNSFCDEVGFVKTASKTFNTNFSVSVEKFEWRKFSEALFDVWVFWGHLVNLITLTAIISPISSDRFLTQSQIN